MISRKAWLQALNTSSLPTPSNTLSMSLLRVILAILFPPLAVIDYGCGSVLIVFLLTLCGWVPGVIAALVILNRNRY